MSCVPCNSVRSRLWKFALRRPQDLSFPRSRQWAAMRIREHDALTHWRESHGLSVSAGSDAVFLHIPKNGGTSISSALSKYFAFCSFEPGKLIMDSRVILDHVDPNWAVKHRLLRPGSLAGSFLFAVVRNPFSRAQSLFGYFRKRGWINQETSLLDFLRHIGRARPRPGGASVARHSLAAPQTRWLQGSWGGNTFQTFRLEELGALAEALEERFGTSVEFPFLNVGNVGQSINEAEADMVRRVYRDDFRALGYSSMTPRQAP